MSSTLRKVFKLYHIDTYVLLTMYYHCNETEALESALGLHRTI
jgi:hypothetical protein